MRSAQRIKISDTDLIKRLVIVVLIFAAYSAARTVAGTPRVVQGRLERHSGLRYIINLLNTWNFHIFTARFTEIGNKNYGRYQ